MSDEFEKRLREQPMRVAPEAWRGRILRATRPAPPWWRTWLWPHPRAWAGLAAGWMVILAFHLATPNEPKMAGNYRPMTAREFAELRGERLMMARLLGPGDFGEAAPAPPGELRPRSEGPAEHLAG